MWVQNGIFGRDSREKAKAKTQVWHEEEEEKKGERGEQGANKGQCM